MPLNLNRNTRTNAQKAAPYNSAALRLSPLLFALLYTGPVSANNDVPISMSTLAVSKRLPHVSIYAVGGDISKAVEGKLVVLGLTGKLKDQWRWQTEYLGLFTQRGTQDIHDNRARIAATYSHTLEDWRLSVRPLIEYRNSEVLNGFRFRPKFEVSRPLTLLSQKITPAIKLTPSYELKSELITFSFLTIGTKWSISPQVEITGSYIRGISHQRNTDTEGPSVSLSVRL